MDIDFSDIDYDKILWSLVIFLISFFTLRFVKIIVVKRLQKLADKTKNDVDDMIIDVLDSFGWLFYVGLSMYIATRFETLSKTIDQWVFKVFFVILVFYLTKGFTRVINYGFKKILKSQAGKEEFYDPSVLNIANKSINIILWSIAFLVLLQNFGYNVSTLVGGLGIMGIAIAFGIQNILEDLFSIFSIYLDKPFKVGDFVSVGDDTGSIERIGIKSTRLRTLQGQELVVANKDLTASRINNFGKMEERRIVFSLGVTYGTKAEDLKNIPGIVGQIIENQKNVRFDRAHFKTMGDFSLNFEIVYYITTPDYNEYMDIQQDINLDIYKTFEEKGIDFAFPTQTVVLEKGE